MFDNLRNLPAEIWIVSIAVIVIVSVIIFYLRRDFEISEITPAPPWIKLKRVEVKNAMSLRWDPSSESGVLHNLPQPEYGRFIGREVEIKKVISILRPYPRSQHSLVTIDGIGGIGKTSLALEIAHRYLRKDKQIPAREQFKAIIWTSAKQSKLTATGIEAHSHALHNLGDILMAISVVLEGQEITQLDSDKQAEIVLSALTKTRTLLIVDNLETVEDEKVMSFLRELPAPTKAIVTTRHHIDVAYPMHLVGMPWVDAQALIVEECQKKLVTLSNGQMQKLYERTAGVPLAIVWSVARIGIGYDMEAVLQSLTLSTSDIALFCFERSVDIIREKPALLLLKALSLFDQDANREALGYITGLSDLDRDDGLVELQRLSLVNREGTQFKMLPLTREYARAELNHDFHRKDVFEHRYLQWTTTLPFDEVKVGESTWWQKRADHDIRVPLGRTPKGEIAEFVLGGRAGGAHTLVTGRTGTGKSNFIDTLIINLAMNYSPSELAIWLLDPQAEHTTFGKLKLPHEGGIAMECSAAFYIELLRDSIYRGRDGISSERLFVIIDSFDSLFKEINSQGEGTFLFYDLIERARRLGIYFVLVSQSPLKMETDIYNQLSTLVIFPSSEENIKFLLRGETKIAGLLNLPGQAIYQGVYFNRPEIIQVPFLPKPELERNLVQLRHFGESKSKSEKFVAYYKDKQFRSSFESKGSLARRPFWQSGREDRDRPV